MVRDNFQYFPLTKLWNKEEKPDNCETLPLNSLVAERTPYRVWTMNGWGHRRRIKTEEKDKVAAYVWGTKFIQFLAALDVFEE